MNVTKKYLAFGVALGVLAFSSADAKNIMKDSYVGANFGFASVGGKTKTDVTDSGAESGSFKVSTHTAKQVGLMVGREVAMVNDMPVAVELSFDRHLNGGEGSTVIDDNVYKTSLKQRWTFGLHGLLTKAITNELSVSAKLGVLYSRFDVRQRLPHDQLSAPLNAAGSKDEKKNLVAIEPGVRFTYAINECWNAYLEGTYARYFGKTLKLPAAADEKHETKVSPVISAIKVGMSYKI